MSISIIKLTSSHYHEYEKFLLKFNDSLLYSSINYKLLLEDYLNCESEYLLAMKEGKILGALPLMIKNGQHGKVINSLPFYGSNGGVITANSDAQIALLGAYKELASNSDNLCSCYINSPFKGKIEGFSYDYLDSRIGQITPLCEDDSEGIKLMESFHYKTRNMVRKSQKQELSLKIENSSFDFLYQVHKENMDAIGGKAKKLEFFKLIPKYFNAETDYNILLAYKNNKPIAALLLFMHNQTVEYFTPVIKQEFRNIQPMSFLIFEGMKKFQNRGYKYWNWGGTWESQEGVYRFKSRWNAIDYKYDYYISVSNKDILELSSDTLLKEYEGFYTVPFSILKN